MEVNEDILHKPSILQEKVKGTGAVWSQPHTFCLIPCHLTVLNILFPLQPSTEGYIAVVLPKFEESKSVTEGLLTQQQYEEVLASRANATSATVWGLRCSKKQQAFSPRLPASQCPKEAAA